MTRRLLTLGLATAMLALGGMNAWSASVNLGTLVDNFGKPAGTFTVGDLSFSDFTYTPNAIPDTPALHPAGSFTVDSVGSTGIVLSGLFVANPSQRADYLITYKVETTDGSSIGNASLSMGGFAGTADSNANIGETIHVTSFTGPVISKDNFAVFSAGPLSATSELTPPSSVIYVTKDIMINGGTDGANLSAVNQSFSTTGVVVPEPMSMALLGIGLSGLFTFRRFFKRAFAA